MDSFIIILIITFFAILLYRHIRKERTFSVLSFCLSIYLFISICSLLLIHYPESIYKEYELFPTFCFLLLWIISFLPIRRLGHIADMSVYIQSKRLFTFYLWFIAIVGLTALPNLISGFQALSSGITDASVFYELYQDKSSDVSGDTEAVHSSINILAVLRGMTCHLGIFMTMFYFTTRKRNKCLSVCLIICLIISPLSSITTASRGDLARTLLIILFSYLIFRKQYEEKLRRRISIILMSFMGIIIVALSAITISRFTRSYMADDYLSYSLLSYLGQPILNFNDAISNSVLRNGDRVFPLFKMLFFPDGSYTYAARMDAYPNMIVDESDFTTYLGELVLDFGVLGAFVLLTLFSVFLIQIGPKRYNRVTLSELIVVYIVVYNISSGWTLSPFSDISGNLKLVFCFLSWFFFRLK